jgi:acyl-coenzyme A synthetase/AMP-(fatty) acid ligase
MVKALQPLLGPRIPIGLRQPVSPGIVPQLAAEKFGAVPIWLDRPLDVDPGGGTDLDYVRLATLVEELSGALADAGVSAWDRVAINKSPNYDVLLVAAAAARIGAIPVLISTHLSKGAIGVLLSRLHSPYVVADQATVDASGVPGDQWLALSQRLIGPVEGGTPWDDLRGAPVPGASPRKEEEPVFVTHTGGTTGVPKLIEQSVAGASQVVNVEARRWPFGYSPEETLGAYLTWVHARALYHMTAFLSRGASLVALTDPACDNVARMFGAHRPTIVESHPNTYMQWDELCDHADEPFGNVRVYYNSFDAMHPRTIRRLLGASKRRMPLYIQGYGMSETGVITLRFYSRGSARRLGRRGLGSRNVGWPLPFNDSVRVVDAETQRERPRGESGMIQVKTKSRAIGFVDQPAKYWGRRHGNWFDTGDIGRAGPWGTLELLDREVDRIEGVESCILIEDVLFDRIPALREVVIVADDEGRPVPIVCTQGDEPLDRGAWEAATAGLPPLGEPVQVSESEVPRTESAKARRFLIAERTAGGDETIVALRDGA